MASDGEFIVKFIAEAAKKGMGALEAAKKEIEEIDLKLLEAEKSKIRRMKLIEVLEHFGDETHRRRRASNVPTSDDINHESEEFVELHKKIREVLAKAKKPLNVRELVLEVGSYDQDALIMRAVKYLGDLEILSRDEENRIVPGRKW